MFDLESHLDQMLKIALELRDDEHQPKSMTPLQISSFKVIVSCLYRLQELIPLTRQYDPPFLEFRHEWNVPITAISGYTRISLEGLNGELSNDQRDKLDQLKTMVDELRDWPYQSFTSHKDEE